MKYIIYILFFVCFGLSVKAQVPTGFPSQRWAGWIEPTYVVPDSGTIITKRDTNFIPRFVGTTVTWLHAGVDSVQWFWNGIKWNRVSAAQLDTTSLSNRINLKLNISDTAAMLSPYLRKSDTLNKWVQNVYARNDSLFKLKNSTETFVHTFPTSGSGTVTSVALSMPAAFTVSGSPITTSGTFNVSGAGTSAQYIKGNGTLGTFDTSAIPNFFSKVRSEFSGTSPITYNSTTGIFGILNANSTGQKGAATFNNSDFTDNGSALISLAPIGSGGSCLNCQLTIDTKGRITSFADGSIFLLSNAPGAGDTLVVSGDTIKRIYASYGLISTPTASSIALRVDTTLIQKLITANNGLTKTGNNIQLGGALIQATNITSAVGANRIIYSGISSFADGAQMDISTSGSVGIAVRGQTVDGRGVLGVATTGVGVYGTATGSGGYGLFGLSTLGNAIYGRADSGVIWEGAMVPHSNNTIIPARSTTRSSQSLGANGIGYSDDSYIQTSIGVNQLTNRIIYKLTNATDASYTSSFEFWNANNATVARKMAIAGNGQLTLDQYTGTNFQTIDTSFNTLVMDGSGNIFKRSGDAGGGATGPAGGDLTGTYPNPSIATNAVTYAKMQQNVANSLIGNPTGSTANNKAVFPKFGLLFNNDSLKIDTTLLKSVIYNKTGVISTMYPTATITVDTSGRVIYAEAVKNNLGSFNNVSDTASGFRKTSAYFNASLKQTLITPSNPTLQGGSQDITIAAWVKQAVNTNANQIIAAKDDNRTKRGSEYLLGYVSFGTEKFQWQVEQCCHAAPNDGTTYIIASSVAPVSSDIWYFVVGQYDHTNGKIKIWVNMQKDSLTGVPNLINTTNTPFTIGGLPDTTLPGGSSFWNGAIKSVGFWRRVLDSTELATLYNNTNPNAPSPGFNPGNMISGATFSADVPTVLSSYVNSVNYDGVTGATIFSTGVPMLAGSSSLSCWFKPTAFGGVILGLTGSSNCYVRIVNSTTIRVQTITTGTFKDYTVSTMSTGTWYNLIVTRGSSNLTHVYLNGAESSSGGQSQTDIIAINQIAKYWDGGSGVYFNGKVSDLRIYNTLLSGTDIANIQTNTATSAVPVLWYKLNEGSGTTNIDNSSNAIPHPFEYSELPVSKIFEPITTFPSYWDLNESFGVRYDQRLRNIIRDSSVTNLSVDLSRQNQYIYGSTIPTGSLYLSPTTNTASVTGSTVKILVNGGHRAFTAFNDGRVSIGDSIESDNLSILDTANTNAVSLGLRRRDGLLLSGLSTDVSANTVLQGNTSVEIRSGNNNPIYLNPANEGVTVGTPRSTKNKFDVLENGTSIVDTTYAGLFTMSGSTFNTSSGVLRGIAVGAFADGQRASGSNSLKNIALFAQAFNGQENYALWLDSGLFKFRNVPAPPSTFNVLVHGLTDSIVYQLPVSSLGITTLYNGDGTLAGNRTVTGSSNNLTLATIGTFRVNANTSVFSKNDGTIPYTTAILGSGNVLELGYTPTPGTYSKGTGIIIDTNNNASIGATQIPSTAPLYSTGGSTYITGFQNQAGNFYRVDSVISDITANLTQYYFRINAASNNVTITLPTASTAFAGTIGIVYIFKRLDNSANTVTIQASGGNLIDGASSFTLTTQNQAKEIHCASSTAWDITAVK